MAKPSYYVADAGHFNAKIVVCFSDESFQKALIDAKIQSKHNALDIGIAESHYILQEGTQNFLLGIVFNYEEMAKLDALERMGIIYHEVSHTTTHVFEYVGESTIGDESRSYLGQHIFKQVFAIYATEDERRGERNRKVSDKTNKAVVGALLQMAEHSDRGPGSDSFSPEKSTSRGVKNTYRSSQRTSKSRIQRA